VVRNASGYASQMILGVAADATVQSDYAANKLQSEVTDAHIAACDFGDMEQLCMRRIVGVTRWR
jgi:hypothetical protein